MVAGACDRGCMFHDAQESETEGHIVQGQHIVPKNVLPRNLLPP